MAAAPSSDPSAWPLRQLLPPALVVAAAALLRFLSLGAGIPYAIGVDEPEIMVRVVAMLKTGDFNPHFFDYPSLAIYMHLPVAIARFMYGATTGQWNGLAEVEPAHFYLWARALTATFGVATVVLTYTIGLRWSRWHAWLGAALLAVMPLHVRESHFVLADVPATFFATLTLWLALRAVEGPSARRFAAAGVSAGLTVATKYNAGFVVVLPAIAALTATAPLASRLKFGAVSAAGGAAAFLLTAPYTVLDLPNFLNGFAYLASSYEDGRLQDGAAVYMKHLSNALGPVGFFALWAGLTIAGAGLVRGTRRRQWALLLATPLVYFVTIADRSLIYGRYLLPLVPCVCLLVAGTLAAFGGWLRTLPLPPAPRRVVVAVATVALLAYPLRAAIGFTRLIGQRSTTQIAYEWIQREIPTQSMIVIERYDLRLSDSRYKVRHIVDLTRRSYDDYLADGVDYLVASSTAFGPVLAQPDAAPERVARYRALFQQSQLVFATAAGPGRPGPELRVYRLRGGGEQGGALAPGPQAPGALTTGAGAAHRAPARDAGSQRRTTARSDGRLARGRAAG